MKLINYIKKAKTLILWGVVVGLVLGIGVWLVALNDLGSRLATIGAFVVAILTPLIAFIVNNFAPRKKSQLSDIDDTPRNSRIIVLSALVAFVVAIGIVWLTPRIINAVHDYSYYSHDIETVNPNDITIKDNVDMADRDVATLTLPATKHRQLAISFAFKNNAATNLCANAATVTLSGPSATINKVKANTEQIVDLNKPAQPVTLHLRLVFEPETDPSCRLNVTVKSATYSR